MRRVLRTLVLLIVLGAAAAGAIAWWGNMATAPIAGLQERTTFEVPRGASTRSVATALNDAVSWIDRKSGSFGRASRAATAR